MRWLRSFTLGTLLSKLPWIHALAALLQLKLFLGV